MLVNCLYKNLLVESLQLVNSYKKEYKTHQQGSRRTQASVSILVVLVLVILVVVLILILILVLVQVASVVCSGWELGCWMMWQMMWRT